MQIDTHDGGVTLQAAQVASCEMVKPPAVKCTVSAVDLDTG
jgi:hypothetical protein